MSINIDSDVKNFVLEEMSNHDLNPGPFCGRKSEDAEAWLKAVMNWVVYKRLNVVAALAAVALLLKEGALQWFDNYKMTYEVRWLTLQENSRRDT